jgi:hypothetical protein
VNDWTLSLWRKHRLCLNRRRRLLLCCVPPRLQLAHLALQGDDALLERRRQRAAALFLVEHTRDCTERREKQPLFIPPQEIADRAAHQ